MNQQVLDRLLEAYYAGTSTCDEERELRSLLMSEDLPPAYEHDMEVILSLSGDSIQIPEPDAGFELRIMDAISKQEISPRTLKLRRMIYSSVAAAATVLILVSTWLILDRSGEPTDTFHDPVLAYNATIEVLMQVSETMNSGRSALDDLSVISTTTENLVKLSEQQKLVTKKMEPLGLFRGSSAENGQPADDERDH